MPFINAFEHFNPLKDELPNTLPSALNDVVRRARRFIQKRSHEELRWGAAMLHVIHSRNSHLALKGAIEEMDRQGTDSEYGCETRTLQYIVQDLGLPTCTHYEQMSHAELFALLAVVITGEMMNVHLENAKNRTMVVNGKTIHLQLSDSAIHSYATDAMEAVCFAELIDAVRRGGRSDRTLIDRHLKFLRSERGAKLNDAKKRKLDDLKSRVCSAAAKRFPKKSARFAGQKLALEFNSEIKTTKVLRTDDIAHRFAEWISAARKGKAAPRPNKFEVVIPVKLRPDRR